MVVQEDQANLPPAHNKAIRSQHVHSTIKRISSPSCLLDASGHLNPARSSYINEAIQQLSCLSKAVGQENSAREKLLHALELSAGDWARGPIPSRLDKSSPVWLSDVSNDHSPVEYSLALDQASGEAEVRFLIEAQPKFKSLTALQASVSNLTADIAARYSAIVSLDRLDLIRDLFMPQEPDPESTFVAWHSFAVSTTLEKWKMYLNPHALGKYNASAVTQEALNRLGLANSWNLLESSVISGDDYVIYCAIGMSRNSEVKVYIAHPEASAAQIAKKHSNLDSNADIYEIQQFYSCMAGGSLGPYCGKPPISCFHFKRGEDPCQATRTVLFPLDNYATHDADAQQRVITYIQAISAPQVFRARYERAIDAVRRRPLESGRGIHSWASLKMKPGGKRSNTFYLSPELFGPLPDDGLLSDC